MHKLQDLLIDRIVSGLKRKTITTCSRWAEAYRVMGPPFAGNYSFKFHPWAREPHDCDAEIMACQKGAQLGWTEIALNKVFFTTDVKGSNVLYVLPAKNPDASDFSTSRFDPALELSPHLSRLFSEVKNIGHKRAGSANLFIRGSRSKSQLKSVPASLMIFDEVDEMIQENIPLAFERMSGQLEKQAFLLSTPTLDHYGINVFYRQSTQNHWCFICPSCSRWTEFVFPDCLVITGESWTDRNIRNSHLICKECKNILPHEGKWEYLNTGKWVKSYTDRNIEGYHVSQLYSSTVKPYELAVSYLKGLTNPTDEQEFYNSKLGLTHEVEGARITDADIKEAIGNYKSKTSAGLNSIITMGVDVGKWLHWEIDEWIFPKHIQNDVNLAATCRVIAQGKCLNFEELDHKMRQFKVKFAVVDANPERRKALEFAQRFHGFVRICFYSPGLSGKIISLKENHEISVDRTSWLDLSLGRFRARTIKIPQDTSQEYKDHIKALVRIYEKDRSGNPVGRYVKGNEEDHFAHARNYSEIALKLAVGVGQNRNITGIF